MKDKKFSENVENIYTTLSDKQKAEHIRKEETFNKSFIVIGIILALIILGAIIGLSIMLVTQKEYWIMVLVIGVCFVFLIMPICLIRVSIKMLKATDEIKIKTRIERLEKQKELNRQQALFKNVNYRLNFDNIARVTILDSYTEWSDKLHAVLNYQEIIQTRMYKFKVEYKDGTSNIITAAENLEEYNALIPLVTKNIDTTTVTTQQKSNVGKIREYKQLLDDGIITQEEFEAKKKELL